MSSTWKIEVGEALTASPYNGSLNFILDPEASGSASSDSETCEGCFRFLRLTVLVWLKHRVRTSKSVGNSLVAAIVMVQESLSGI